MKRLFAILLTAALLLTGVSALAVEGTDLAVQLKAETASWQLVSPRHCAFQCEYANQDPDRTVSGFDLAFTAMDRNRNISMTETTQHIVLQIDPLTEKVAPVIYITNPNEMAYLTVSVQAVYFTDGSSEVIDFAAGEKYDTSVFRIY